MKEWENKVEIRPVLTNTEAPTFGTKLLLARFLKSEIPTLKTNSSNFVLIFFLFSLSYNNNTQ